MAGFSTGSLQLSGNAGAPTPPKSPCRNEAFFNNLLFSAYSIQQKEDLIRTNVSKARFNEILATVMDTRSLLRNPTLHIDTAMHLILSRTQKMSGAPGAALCIAQCGMIEYVAGTGVGLGLIGTSFPESQCAFFTRARALPASEWGEVEEPKIKERIVDNFELRVPVCSGGKLVGCLKLFSRIRQFHPEIVHVCELMTAFLGEIIERPSPPVAQEVIETPKESHQATNSGYVWPRMVDAVALTTPGPVLGIEPQRNSIPINNQLPLGAGALTGGQRRAGYDQSEEEQLPTMDELLRQLGVATEEGALLEHPQPGPDQSPERDAVQITATAHFGLPVVPTGSRKPASPVTGTTEPVTPVLAQPVRPGKTRQQESHRATNSGYEWPRMVAADARTTPVPVLRIEPQRDSIPINNQPSFRAGALTGGQRRAGYGQSEEEQLPTLDELLSQLGVATGEGALLEHTQPLQSPESNAVQITAKTHPELPVVPTESTRPASLLRGTIEPFGPVLADPDQPVKPRQTAIRNLRSNLAALIFPTFTLVFCVSLSIRQTPASSLFQVLTLLAIIFSVIEIWRAGRWNR